MLITVIVISALLSLVLLLKIQQYYFELRLILWPPEKENKLANQRRRALW